MWNEITYYSPCIPSPLKRNNQKCYPRMCNKKKYSPKLRKSMAWSEQHNYIIQFRLINITTAQQELMDQGLTSVKVAYKCKSYMKSSTKNVIIVEGKRSTHWYIWKPTNLFQAWFNGCNFKHLYPGRNCRNLSDVFFKLILWINIMSASCEIGLRWMPQNSIHDESTLIQVMAWWRQATSHYLDQCWPRSVSSYGVTRPKWVKHMSHDIIWFEWT